MPTAAHKGAISFGLVHIPVALYTATQDNDISFNQLCRDDGSRVRYKKVCGNCDKEITNADIIKGFEYDKGKYVVVDDADFEKIKTAKDRTLQILHFTDLTSIRPIYFERSYHAMPETGGDRAYELLRAAMLAEGKVAIGKTVLGNKETLLAIVPTTEELLVQTLYFADEVKALPKEVKRPEVSDQELQMAKQLIVSMNKPFAPEEHHDEYQARLRALLEDKIAGRQIMEPQAEQESNIVDLMELLSASVEQAGGKAKPAKRTRKKPGDNASSPAV